MNDNSSLSTQLKPHPFDLALVVIGPTLFGAVLGMFNGSSWSSVLGFVTGCALAATAWWRPKLAGLVIVVLSVPAVFYGLVFTLYNFKIVRIQVTQ